MRHMLRVQQEHFVPLIVGPLQQRLCVGTGRFDCQADLANPVDLSQRPSWRKPTVRLGNAAVSGRDPSSSNAASKLRCAISMPSGGGFICVCCFARPTGTCGIATPPCSRSLFGYRSLDPMRSCTAGAETRPGLPSESLLQGGARCSGSLSHWERSLLDTNSSYKGGVSVPRRRA